MRSATGTQVGNDILREAAICFGMPGGVLYEQREPFHSPFEPSAVVGIATGFDDLAPFAPLSLVPRWLRVNRLCLAIPDGIGVFDAAPQAEQAALRRLSAALAVPLAVDDVMVGWIALVGPRASASIGSTTIPPAEARRWAEQLQSDRRATEAAARAETLDQSNRLSLAGRMAAGIAHEVRNPLAAVRSIVQLIRSNDAPPGDSERLLDNAIAEIDRVNEVLTGLLTLGRASDARVEVIDLTDVLAGASFICQAYARTRGQSIRMGQATRVPVFGDPHELRQVFVNVLLNACQASPDGGLVYAESGVSAGQDGQRLAVVRISDAGTGIPPTVIDRVFEPFFSTKADGGGLGLALCREAMYRHNGDVLISSQFGVGTVVTLQLPLRGADGEDSGR